MKKPKISDLRAQLQDREKSLRSNMEEQSSKVEHFFNDNLVKAAAIGVGVVGGFFIIRALTKSQKKKKKSVLKTATTSSRVTKTIVSEALKRIIPYAIDKIKTKEPEETK